MLSKLTREGKVSAKDMREVLSTGVSRQQVEDALAVGRLIPYQDSGPQWGLPISSNRLPVRPWLLGAVTL